MKLSTLETKVDAGGVLWDMVNDAHETLNILKEELRAEAQEEGSLGVHKFEGNSSVATVEVTHPYPEVTGNPSRLAIPDSLRHQMFEQRWHTKRGFRDAYEKLSFEQKQEVLGIVRFVDRPGKVRIAPLNEDE